MIMETFTGLEVNPLNMQPNQILITDIAHALSLQCRFNGHCKYFYSVAQHSIHVGKLFNESHLRLFGLLHDAAEAYLGDIINPLKEAIPAYKVHEDILQTQIFLVFCCRPPSYSEQQRIKEADTRLLLTEAKFLLPSHGKNWRKDFKPFIFDIHPLSPEDAEAEFLLMYDRLYRKLNK